MKSAHKGFTPSLPRGFTLIEVLIVIVIISILTGVLIANFNNFISQRAFQNDAEEMLANIRLIQNNVLTGVNDCADSPPYTTWSGWYIKVDEGMPGGTTSYKTAELCYDPNTSTYQAKHLIETKFSEGVEITKFLSGGGVCPGSTEGYYIFQPPNGILKWGLRVGGPVDQPNSLNDISVPAVAFELRDTPNWKFKGIGISPAGGTTLKNLSAGQWICPPPTPWDIF